MAVRQGLETSPLTSNLAASMGGAWSFLPLSVLAFALFAVLIQSAWARSTTNVVMPDPASVHIEGDDNVAQNNTMEGVDGPKIKGHRNTYSGNSVSK